MVPFQTRRVGLTFLGPKLSGATHAALLEQRRQTARNGFGSNSNGGSLSRESRPSVHQPWLWENWSRWVAISRVKRTVLLEKIAVLSVQESPEAIQKQGQRTFRWETYPFIVFNYMGLLVHFA